VLCEGKILDGRNRYLACKKLDLEPNCVTIKFGDPFAYVALHNPTRPSSIPKSGDPISFVLSHNLHRRHLSVAQRALVAARVKASYAKAAKERQVEHGRTAPGKPGENTSRQQSVTDRHANEASAEAGAALGVSGKSVERAEKVLEHGSPELIAAVEAGATSITQAAQLVAEHPRKKRRVGQQAKIFRQMKQLWEQADTHHRDIFLTWCDAHRDVCLPIERIS